MYDLSELTDRLVARYGLSGTVAAKTDIESVRLIYQDEGVPRSPCVYASGIFLIIKGSKVGYLGGQEYAYGNERYLTLGLPLAMDCETFASAEAPLFAIYIAVTPSRVRAIAGKMKMGLEAPINPEVAIRSTTYGTAMADVVGRLMEALCSEEDSHILGEALVQEIIYRSLQGPAKDALRGLLAADSATSRIATVMEAMHTRYAERLSVDDMADMAGMSPSVFHRAFRQVTDDTPLQYLKKVRLMQAGSLIARDNYRVSMAASAVGYESAAHFSRDFKNHFGIAPTDARKLGYAFIRNEIVS